MRTELTAERLRQVLRYDPETGNFEWLETYRNVRTGHAAGTAVSKVDNRIRIQVDGRTYRASRLAWLYMTGEWPTLLVDHEDRNPANNRWKNLRELTIKQNRENSNPRGCSASGRIGVTWDRARRKWAAQIYHNARAMRLGYHGTLIDAVAARMRAERLYFTHAALAKGQVQ